ncbi:MAG: hypothetical protein GC161_07985 [Planctomycetaceae bacterium]|nr:hypothetical protein [Planctomycetaceae bacterium]
MFAAPWILVCVPFALSSSPGTSSALAQEPAPRVTDGTTDVPPAAAETGLRAIALGAAPAAAKAARLPMVVVALADWSGPSQRFAAGALADKDVVRLLGERSIALRLDVPRLPEADLEAWLLRHRIDELPAVLVLEAGEREIGRLVGHREGPELARSLSGLLEAARPSRALAATLSPADMERPLRRLELANVLVAEKAFGEALEHLLWCYDLGASKDPTFAALRNGPVIAQLGRVARDHEAARLALETRQAQARASLVAGLAKGGVAADFAALSRAIGRRGDVLALYDALAAPDAPGRTLRASLFEEVARDLVAAGRDRDALEGAGDPLGRLEQRIEEQRRAAQHPVPGAENLQLLSRQRAVNEGLLWFGPLLRTDRRVEANAVADRLVNFDPSDATFAELVRIAAASGRSAVARDLVLRARAALPADRRPLLEAVAAELLRGGP